MQCIFMDNTGTDTGYTGTEGQTHWICYVDKWMSYTVVDGTLGLVLLGHRSKLTIILGQRRLVDWLYWDKEDQLE